MRVQTVLGRRYKVWPLERSEPYHFAASKDEEVDRRRQHRHEGGEQRHGVRRSEERYKPHHDHETYKESARDWYSRYSRSYNKRHEGSHHTRLTKDDARHRISTQNRNESQLTRRLERNKQLKLSYRETMLLKLNANQRRKTSTTKPPPLRRARAADSPKGRTKPLSGASRASHPSGDPEQSFIVLGLGAPCKTLLAAEALALREATWKCGELSLARIKWYLQDLVYKLSKVGQAIENNDLEAACLVLGKGIDTGWVKTVNLAFTKVFCLLLPTHNGQIK
ncbi:hypothetical protein YC2023_023884 [Brassica napus]